MTIAAAPAIPSVRIDGSLAVVEFDRFDLAAYETRLGRFPSSGRGKMRVSRQPDTSRRIRPAQPCRALSSFLAVSGLGLPRHQSAARRRFLMPKRIDLTGQRFGRLMVIAAAPPLNGNTRELCRCDCGNEVTVSRSNLRAGRTASCGCVRTEGSKAANTTHGMSGTRIFKRWTSMRNRCSNPNDEHWPFYGGRGIRVCERWQRFENFYADMGDPPAGTTLDRIDVDGDYEPSNCRWANSTEQARNRRNTPTLTYGGETLSYAEWAARMGVSVQTIHGRVKGGWTVEQTLGITPPPPTMRGWR